jgi:cyclohexyl-isocyanide hydratase
MTQSHTITVVMLLFPNLTRLDLTGPYEVFARMPDTVVTLLAETRAPVRSERGLTITPDTSIAEATQYDVLFVPGGIGVNAMNEQQSGAAPPDR